MPRWDGDRRTAQFDVTRVEHAGSILVTVRKSPRKRGVEPGSLYRDLDGQLVRLVKVKRNLCIWVPILEADSTRHVTHCDNFVQRFTPLKKKPGSMVA